METARDGVTRASTADQLDKGTLEGIKTRKMAGCSIGKAWQREKGKPRDTL